MDRLAVGALVVVEDGGQPVGIVTDRPPPCGRSPAG